MKIQILSDIHLEFENHKLSNSNNADVLVLAGDIAPINTSYYRHFIDHACDLFEDVIVVLGNHEFYQNDFKKANRWLSVRDNWMGQSNLHILNNSGWSKSDVTFVGGILWTDLNNSDWFAVRASQQLNDYPMIDSFNSVIWLEEHAKTKQYLVDTLPNLLTDKVVVVTHHSPLLNNSKVAARHPITDITYSFHCTDMEGIIAENKPDVWINGHTHSVYDYMWMYTRMIENSKGYRTENYGKFDPDKTIEI